MVPDSTVKEINEAASRRLFSILATCSSERMIAGARREGLIVELMVHGGREGGCIKDGGTCAWDPDRSRAIRIPYDACKTLNKVSTSMNLVS